MGYAPFYKGVVTLGTGFDQTLYHDKCVTPTSNTEEGYTYWNGQWFNYNSWDGDSCSGSECYVAEFECWNTRLGMLEPPVIECPQGCSDGACLFDQLTIDRDIDPFVFEGYDIWDVGDGYVMGAEYKYSETLGKNFVTVFRSSSNSWDRMYNEIIRQILQNNVSLYEVASNYVYRGNMRSVGYSFEYYVWPTAVNVSVAIAQHDEISSDALLQAYLQKYPSTLISQPPVLPSG